VLLEIGYVSGNPAARARIDRIATDEQHSLWGIFRSDGLIYRFLSPQSGIKIFDGHPTHAIIIEPESASMDDRATAKS
jgi:hypothetical protein